MTLDLTQGYPNIDMLESIMKYTNLVVICPMSTTAELETLLVWLNNNYPQRVTMRFV